MTPFLPLSANPGFCHDHALILYVYLPNDESGTDSSVLTVRPPFRFRYQEIP